LSVVVEDVKQLIQQLRPEMTAVFSEDKTNHSKAVTEACGDQFQASHHVKAD